MSPRVERRLVAGLVAAPVIATAATVALFAIAAEWAVTASYFPPLLPTAEDLAFITGWSLLFSSVVTILGAAPLAFAVRRRRRITLGLCAAVSPALGASPFLLLGLVAACFAAGDRELSRLPWVEGQLLPFIVVATLAGLCGGMAFYVVGIRSHIAGAGAT